MIFKILKLACCCAVSRGDGAGSERRVLLSLPRGDYNPAGTQRGWLVP